MKIRILIVLLFFINSIQAKDLFWIGNSGDWNNVNHWSYTSGGVSCGFIPTASDNVVFDDNSFKSNGSAVNFTNASVLSLSYESSFSAEFLGHELIVAGDFLLQKYAYFNG